jgi:hypothetical protein
VFYLQVPENGCFIGILLKKHAFACLLFRAVNPTDAVF